MSKTLPYEKSWYNEVIWEKGGKNRYKTKKSQSRRKSEQIKLDQIMQVLFKLSKRVTLPLLNSLFDEHFIAAEVKLYYENSHFVEDHFGRIIGDLFIRVEQGNRVYRYHIEFQTLNDMSMVLRMFRYGFDHAVEQVGRTEIKKTTLLEFPRQRVIFLEKNERIPSELSLNLRLPDGQLVSYRVPVMKYWEYSAEDLQKHKMYALLLLQVFTFRKEIHRISQSELPEKEKRRYITNEFGQLKERLQEVIHILREIHDKQEIYTGDLGRILEVVQNITDYLYKRYDEYKNIEEEVHHMIKTLYDPEVERRGERRGERKGERKGKVESIFLLLEEYGSLPETLKQKIKQEENIERLNQWLKVAAKASSIDDFIREGQIIRN